MENAVVKRSVIASLAERSNMDPAKLVPMLKKTAFATCRNDEEFMAMCVVANTYDLNPILKEIYAFPSKGGAVVPIVGVDGWIKMMNRNPAFDGIEFDEAEDGTKCTATIHLKGHSHPVKVTEYLAECRRPTDPWKQSPRRMLRHKALIQAARIAFGFSGIYDSPEEAVFIDVPPEVKTAEPETPQKPQQGGGKLRGLLLRPDAERSDSSNATDNGNGIPEAEAADAAVTEDLSERSDSLPGMEGEG